MLYARYVHRIVGRLSKANNIPSFPRSTLHLVPAALNCDVTQNKLSTGWTLEKASEIKFAVQSSESSSVTISHAVPQNDQEMLKIHWGEGYIDLYPYIWLRDNCQCSKCFHASSKARLIPLHDLSLPITPTGIEVNETGEVIQILWSDGHKGIYPSGWLQKRSFSESKREQNHNKNRFHHSHWGSEMVKDLPSASFNELLHSDEALVEFILKLEEYGLTIVRGTPTRRGEVLMLSNRLGFHKRTHYGNTFAVKQKVDAVNLAYTAGFLDVHVDMPYIYYKPEVQLLHCIAQTKGEGGENHLVDSFHVAQQLQNLHPEKYEILTRVLVDYKDEGAEADGMEFHTHTKVPIISLDYQGEMKAVNFNHMTRDSYFDVSVDKVRDWYDAMLTFHTLLSHPDNVITYKLKEGDILIMDNNRVMHGRQEYHMTEGSRELEGCYWDWDMVKSCRRVLEKRLADKCRYI